MKCCCDSIETQDSVTQEEPEQMMTDFEYKKQIRKSLKEAHNFVKKKNRLNYQKFLYIIIEK